MYKKKFIVLLSTYLSVLPLSVSAAKNCCVLAMYQSTLNSALLRKFKGEEGKADYVDLSNGFISPGDLTAIAKAMTHYSSGHAGASTVIEMNLSFNQICGVNSRGLYP